MLSDLIVGRAISGGSRIDPHRYAVWSCAVGRVMRRIARLFG